MNKIKGKLLQILFILIINLR